MSHIITITSQINKYLENITYFNFNFENYFNNIIIPLLCIDDVTDNYTYKIENNNTIFKVSIKKFRNMFLYDEKEMIWLGTRLILKSKYSNLHDNNVELIFYINNPFSIVHSVMRQYKDNETINLRYYKGEVNYLLDEYFKTLILNKLNKDVCSIIFNYIGTIFYNKRIKIESRMFF